MLCAPDCMCIEDDQGNGGCESKQGLVEADGGSGYIEESLTIIEGEAAGTNFDGESFTDENLYIMYGPVTAIEIKSGFWIATTLEQGKLDERFRKHFNYEIMPISFRYGDTWGPLHGGDGGVNLDLYAS